MSPNNANCLLVGAGLTTKINLIYRLLTYLYRCSQEGPEYHYHPHLTKEEIEGEKLGDFGKVVKA